MAECGATGSSETEVECRKIAELLGDYIDGSLPRREQELIDWHIEGCPPCVAFVNTYRGTIGAAQALREVQIPPELKSRLIAVLRAADRPTHQPRPS
jgi:anti-sigma factor RsiW